MASLRLRTRKYFVAICAFTVVFLVVISWNMYGKEVLHFHPLDKRRYGTGDRQKVLKTGLEAEALKMQNQSVVRKSDKTGNETAVSDAKTIAGKGRERVSEDNSGSDKNREAGVHNLAHKQQQENALSLMGSQHAKHSSQQLPLERRNQNRNSLSNKTVEDQSPLNQGHDDTVVDGHVGGFPQTNVENGKADSKDGRTRLESSGVQNDKLQNKFDLPAEKSSHLQSGSQAVNRVRSKTQTRVQVPLRVLRTNRSDNGDLNSVKSANTEQGDARQNSFLRGVFRSSDKISAQRSGGGVQDSAPRTGRLDDTDRERARQRMYGNSEENLYEEQHSSLNAVRPKPKAEPQTGFDSIQLRRSRQNVAQDGLRERYEPGHKDQRQLPRFETGKGMKLDGQTSFDNPKESVKGRKGLVSDEQNQSPASQQTQDDNDTVHQHGKSGSIAQSEKAEAGPTAQYKSAGTEKSRQASKQGLNETVLNGVARHNKLLRTLQEKMEKLKRLPLPQRNENVQNLLEKKWKAANAWTATKPTRADGDKNEEGVKSSMEKTAEEVDKGPDKNDPDDDLDDSGLDKNDPEETNADTEYTGDMSDRDNQDAEDKVDMTERPSSCKDCFPSSFPTLLDHRRYCHGMSHQPIVMLMIFSSPNHADERQAIRETWGSRCQDPSSDYRCLFVVGQTKDEDLNNKILQENDLHKDVLQFAFYDSYTNLTYKTMASLHWVATNCPDISYVMKTDDDMFINTELIPIMLTAAPKTDFMGGFCWGQSSPDRNSLSKWYVPLLSYSARKFPPMCSGTGYIMSRDVMSKVLTASHNIPFFHLEDVYIALCLKEYNMRPMRIRGFNNMFTQFTECGYKFSVMSSHEVPPGALREYWKRMQECSGRYPSGKELFVEMPYPVTD